MKLTKQNLGWPLEPEFYIPDEVLAHFRQAIERGARAEAEWNERFAAYEKAYPEEAAEFKRIMAGELPVGWKEALAPLPKSAGSPPAISQVFALTPWPRRYLSCWADLPIWPTPT